MSNSDKLVIHRNQRDRKTTHFYDITKSFGKTTHSLDKVENKKIKDKKKNKKNKDKKKHHKTHHKSHNNANEQGDNTKNIIEYISNILTAPKVDEPIKVQENNRELNTVAQKCLLIGINYTGSSNELNGCINDSENLKDFLIAQNILMQII